MKKNSNYEKENNSPNIGELKPSKRKLVVRTLTKQEQEARRRIAQNSDNTIDYSATSQNQKQHHGPLSGRDPLRHPLQSRLPFTVAPLEKGNKKTEKRPAYAFKSVESSLLKISEHPPNDYDIEMGSDDGQPARFYPIALNDGAVGLHTGSNFGKGGFNSMSHNTHRPNCNTVNPIVTFPWNEGDGTFSNEKAKLKKTSRDQTRNSDQSILNVESGDTDDIETIDSESHGENRMMFPWKEWGRLNNQMTPLPIFGGGRDLPRLPKQHKTKSSRKSGIYNQDDFDYAVVLRPMKEYEECAAVLNLASEMDKSIFDRAIAGGDYSTPVQHRKLRKSGSKRKSRLKARKRASSTSKFSPPNSKSPIKTTHPSSTGRRLKSTGLRSAPIKSVGKRSPKKRPTINWPNKSSEKRKTRHNGKSRKGNPNILDIQDLPNPKVPRGMSRKHGLEEFLWALEQGFVVRRHRPGHDPVFLKLYSKNRGDTIHYEYIGAEDAKTALRGQIQRYGNNNVRAISDKKVRQKISPWAPGYNQSGDFDQQSISSEMKNESQRALSLEQYNTSLPENESRHSSIGGIIGSVTNFTSTKITKAVHSGSFKAANVVDIQRATHDDPLSYREEDIEEEKGIALQGSHTFRECKEINNRKWLQLYAMHDLDNEQNIELKRRVQEEYERKVPESTRSFSLIFQTMIPRFSSTQEAHIEYYKKTKNGGKASYRDFSFLDLETATNGEYWMLFRGFLLLQRDAYNGEFRMAKSD